MNHQEFLEFVKSLLGRLPHMEAKESLGVLIKSRGFSFRFVDRWIPKGTMGSNPKNPLNRVDGILLEIGACNQDGFTIYVPEDARK